MESPSRDLRVALHKLSISSLTVWFLPCSQKGVDVLYIYVGNRHIYHAGSVSCLELTRWWVKTRRLGFALLHCLFLLADVRHTEFFACSMQWLLFLWVAFWIGGDYGWCLQCFRLFVDIGCSTSSCTLSWGRFGGGLGGGIWLTTGSHSIGVDLTTPTIIFIEWLKANEHQFCEHDYCSPVLDFDSYSTYKLFYSHLNYGTKCSWIFLT